MSEEIQPVIVKQSVRMVHSTTQTLTVKSGRLFYSLLPVTHVPSPFDV